MRLGRQKFSRRSFCGWILGQTKANWARFDLQRTQWLRYYKIREAGIPFRRSIEISQNATRAPNWKSQALKSGSNQAADIRLAVRVRGKIGDIF